MPVEKIPVYRRGHQACTTLKAVIVSKKKAKNKLSMPAIKIVLPIR